jgi:hypothetical protein
MAVGYLYSHHKRRYFEKDLQFDAVAWTRNRWPAVRDTGTPDGSVFDFYKSYNGGEPNPGNPQPLLYRFVPGVPYPDLWANTESYLFLLWNHHYGTYTDQNSKFNVRLWAKRIWPRVYAGGTPAMTSFTYEAFHPRTKDRISILSFQLPAPQD